MHNKHIKTNTYFIIIYFVFIIVVEKRKYIKALCCIHFTLYPRSVFITKNKLIFFALLLRSKIALFGWKTCKKYCPNKNITTSCTYQLYSNVFSGEQDTQHGLHFIAPKIILFQLVRKNFMFFQCSMWRNTKTKSITLRVFIYYSTVDV